MTAIPYASAVYNVISGCTKKSIGCHECWAEAVAKRFGRPWPDPPVFLPEKLEEPLHWRKPRTVFCCSTSDLFHEAISFEQIASVFGVMAATPHHRYLILSKRPERMLEWFRWVQEGVPDPAYYCFRLAMDRGGYGEGKGPKLPGWKPQPWPLRNVIPGVSAENQPLADERISKLLQCPAAGYWISLEPLLERIELDIDWLVPKCPICGRTLGACLSGDSEDCPGPDEPQPKISFCVVGAESGPKRRPCRVEWIRSVAEQCKVAKVPVYVKQASSLRPGQQGDIPDDLWALKQTPWEKR